jgi:hypothetical protein
MTDIFLNTDTNDIDLVNSVMRLTANTEELTRQRVQIWLGIFKGEWLFNIVAGIPYLANDNNPEQLLGVASNKDSFDRAIREGIITRAGIIDLTSYTSTLDNLTRTLTINFKATTEDGPIVIEDVTITV